MGEVKWVKMSIDMFDNRKIKYLRGLPEGNNIVLIWVMLLTLAGRCNSNGYIFLTENIPYTPAMLANELGFPESTILVAMKALESMGMISRNEENTLLIPGWEEHQNVAALEQIRASNRKRQARYREQAKIEAVEQETGEARGTRRTRRTEAVEKGGGNQRSKDSFRAVVEPVSEQKRQGAGK